MLKRLFLVSISIILLSGCGITSNYRIIDSVKEKDIEIESPPKKLCVGEKFTYMAEWLGMDVGTVTLTVQGITEKNSRQVYHILAIAESSPLISKIYKVEDKISTYLDVKGLYPVRFEKEQREGGYRSDEFVDFDHEKGMAYYFSRLNNTKKEYDIPKKVQDPLSCLYYLRLQDVDIGKSVFASVNAEEKNYLLEAKVHRKGFIKIRDVGEWEAFMVEPLPWFQGEVKRKAKATFWFTVDQRRIPLLVTTSGIPFVGTITISLKKIEYLDSPSQ